MNYTSLRQARRLMDSPDKGRVTVVQERATKNRECGACGKMNIPESSASYISKCKQCFSFGKPLRNEYKVQNFAPCQCCGDLSISIADSSWRTLCASCYKKSLTECKECAAPLDRDEMQRKVCTSCLESLEALKRTCANCGEDKIEHDARVETVLCVDCEEKAPKRACSVCGEMKISEEEPRWKTKCLACFKLSK